MGKIQIISKNQEKILDWISNESYLRENFYFTGGTALSLIYLKHRTSIDLDFFSEEKIDQEVIFAIVSDWSKKYKFKFVSRFVQVVYRFEFDFGREKIKLDFGYYPYKRIESGRKFKSLTVDSLKDIATNKLLTINQRTDIKDFVDIYFLLQTKYTFWDLLYGLEVKFKKLDVDSILLAEDFLKAEDFKNLPKMIKPLKLAKLKEFYRNLAIKLGKTAVVE